MLWRLDEVKRTEAESLAARLLRTSDRRMALISINCQNETIEQINFHFATSGLVRKNSVMLTSERFGSLCVR